MFQKQSYNPPGDKSAKEFWGQISIFSYSYKKKVSLLSLDTAVSGYNSSNYCSLLLCACSQPVTRGVMQKLRTWRQYCAPNQLALEPIPPLDFQLWVKFSYLKPVWVRVSLLASKSILTGTISILEKSIQERAQSWGKRAYQLVGRAHHAMNASDVRDPLKTSRHPGGLFYLFYHVRADPEVTKFGKTYSGEQEKNYRGVCLGTAFSLETFR